MKKIESIAQKVSNITFWTTGSLVCLLMLGLLFASEVKNVITPLALGKTNGFLMEITSLVSCGLVNLIVIVVISAAIGLIVGGVFYCLTLVLLHGMRLSLAKLDIMVEKKS